MITYSPAFSLMDRPSLVPQKQEFCFGISKLCKWQGTLLKMKHNPFFEVHSESHSRESTVPPVFLRNVMQCANLHITLSMLLKTDLVVYY